jgi:hypothetical protein
MTLSPVQNLPLDGSFDVIVVGGGVAGTVAAIAAARGGSTVALVQDRPVLGGNSSSEVRVGISGADAHGTNRNARETGILEELRLEMTCRDSWPEGNGTPRPLWDWLLWEWVRREPNLTLYLNTRGLNAIMPSDSVIDEIVVLQTSTERSFRLKGKIFIDCSGDGQIAADAGAEFVMGRESRYEHDESRAPEKADDFILCASLLFSSRDTGAPVSYTPPSWARIFPADDVLKMRFHPYINRGYSWIEYGGMLDPIKEAEPIRDELIRLLFGVWDHVKNHGEHGAENFALDWVGPVIGKRESRRFVGDHVLNQNDVERQTPFEDRVAYCGWGLDHLHPPDGIYSEDPPGMWPQQLYLMGKYQRWYPYGTLVKSLYPNPPAHWPDYLAPLRGLASIPFRSLYSRNIENLLFAGRNISATHVAFGSTRVQATGAVMGQAVGTAAALCIQRQLTPRELGKQYIHVLQQQLLKDDCYIIGIANSDPNDIALRASVTESSHAKMEMIRGDRWLDLSWKRGQMISLSEPHVDTISLLLKSTLDEETTVHATLFRGNHLTDFYTQEQVAQASALVPATSDGWCNFAFGADVDPAYPYWVCLDQSDGIGWAYTADEILGTQRAEWFDLLSDWYSVRGTHCFRLTPESFPYRGKNTVNGFGRPEQGPNLWLSDPEQALPQWVELEFDRPQPFDAIYLTFDTNLDAAVDEKLDPGAEGGVTLQQLSGAPKSGAASECVRDYRVQIFDGRDYTDILTITGNYQRRRIHYVKPLTARKVRIVVEATNGANTARIYEVRLYDTSNRPDRVSS